MNQQPKISIIVPVYGVEQYIAKCLTSIQNQTFTDFECIVVDDGSPDQSISKAKKLVGDDPRFIFLEKENGGLPSARNYGLDYASGNYIAFLDSDDYYDLNFLKDMLTNILDTNADIAICDINLVDLSCRFLEKTDQDLRKYYKLNDLFLCADTISAYAWNKLYKSEIFKTARYDEDVKTYEDSHFTFRTLYKKKIIHVKKPLYNYLQRPGSITKSLPPTLIKDKLNVIKCYQNFIIENKGVMINNDYYVFCYLKEFLFLCAALFARYSPNYYHDINALLSQTNKNYFSFKNIYKTMKFSKKIATGLALLKIHPFLFKLAIQINRSIKNN